MLIDRRALLASSAVAGLASLVPRGTALAGSSPLPAVLHTPPGIPGDIAHVLDQVDDANDKLHLATWTRLDGAVQWHTADVIVYADMPPSDPDPRLAHGTELIRYKTIQASHLICTGDDQLTRLYRKLVVAVDAHGNRLTTWRNPIDGLVRPVPPIFLRSAKGLFQAVDGRFTVGTPDLVCEPPCLSTPPGGIRQWSLHVVRAHNLREKLQIPESFGHAGNVTENTINTTHIAPLPATDVLPVAIPTMHVRVRTTPFPPELAFPADLCGQIMVRTTLTSIAGLNHADQWLRDLVQSDYPDLLLAPDPASLAAWDDTKWSAFYRDYLEPHNMTWQEWAERSVIKD